jgi:hypothetical protein
MIAVHCCRLFGRWRYIDQLPTIKSIIIDGLLNGGACFHLLSDLFALLCSGKRFFVVTFTGSIMWIAAFSYLMVWWANLTGETVNIPPEVSPSLTFFPT